jgi:hypothetical protein
MMAKVLSNSIPLPYFYLPIFKAIEAKGAKGLTGLLNIFEGTGWDFLESISDLIKAFSHTGKHKYKKGNKQKVIQNCDPIHCLICRHAVHCAATFTNTCWQLLL